MDRGFSREDGRYCIFDNVLTPGRIYSILLSDKIQVSLTLRVLHIPT